MKRSKTFENKKSDEPFFVSISRKKIAELLLFKPSTKYEFHFLHPFLTLCIGYNTVQIGAV
jgi:hypothetical protein